MNDSFDDFKKWYYLNVALAECKNDSIKDIDEYMKNYQINDLQDFINNYLDAFDYNNDQKRFFDCASFCKNIIYENDYNIYIKCEDGYKMIDMMDFADLYEEVYMEVDYIDGSYKCITAHNSYIINEM